MKIKWPFLFLIIALPVLVYLFLQLFGQNKFDLPVYYEDGILKTLEGCDFVGNVPYRVNHFSVNSVNKIVVYGFSTGEGYNVDELNNLKSFFNRYKDETSVQFAALSTDILLNQKLNYRSVSSEIGGRSEILNFARCYLQADISYDSAKKNFKKNQLVLCDQERKIRGYYDYADLKEIDRLNTEIDILLQQKNAQE